jgi:hypothetical protein
LEKTREEQIRELKAMRAELMAIKEQIESDEGNSEATSETLAALKKQYMLDVDDIKSQGVVADDAKHEIYSQYQDEEQVYDDGQAKRFVRDIRR